MNATSQHASPPREAGAALCPCCRRPMPEPPHGIVLNPVHQTVIYRGRSVRLRRTVFEMFVLLHARIGRPVGAGALYDHLYGLRPDCDQPGEDIVKVHTYHLRRALEPLGLTITTIYGGTLVLERPEAES